jgi:ribosomal-protein-alanine N-acetyltransferase
VETEINTERLNLKIITEDDSDFMISIVNSKGWLQFIGDRNVHSKKDSIRYIMKIKETQDFYYWIVRLKKTGIPVGIISFIKRSYLENFDIGFAFLPEYNGCGYAYEAAEKVLSLAGKKPEHSIVLATTIPENINSIKLLTKLGMHFEKEIDVENSKLQVYRISQVSALFT